MLNKLIERFFPEEKFVPILSEADLKKMIEVDFFEQLRSCGVFIREEKILGKASFKYTMRPWNMSIKKVFKISEPSIQKKISQVLSRHHNAYKRDKENAYKILKALVQTDGVKEYSEVEKKFVHFITCLLFNYLEQEIRNEKKFTSANLAQSS
jgi:L-rhamnose mutarotase